MQQNDAKIGLVWHTLACFDLWGFMVSLVQSSYETLRPTKSPLAKTGATHMSKKILHGIACSCLVLSRIIIFSEIIATKGELNTSCHKGSKLSQEGSWDREPLLKKPSVHSQSFNSHIFTWTIPANTSRTPRPDPGFSVGKCNTKVTISARYTHPRVKTISNLSDGILCILPPGHCRPDVVEATYLHDFAWQRRSPICTERKYVCDENIFNVYDSRMRRSAQVVVQNMQKSLVSIIESNPNVKNNLNIVCCCHWGHAGMRMYDVLKPRNVFHTYEWHVD